jgi:1-aminocyclopropane-1-carboxylate deaminase
MSFDLKNIVVQPLNSLSSKSVQLSTLRTDLIHPVVSGNKWFKLRFYLEEAKRLKCNTIASFGGAYSNHIVALAAVCQMEGLHSAGFIRGESGDSPTLADAKTFGMTLQFIDRENYKYKEVVIAENCHPDWFWIPEGGFGILGANGAATILDLPQIATYTHILCACGTGTMMAGLVKASLPHQSVVGISVLKNNSGLNHAVQSLLPPDTNKKINTIHDYHFGGYAKHPPALIDYMNDFYLREKVPTDLVYTAKLFYAAEQLLKSHYFPDGSRVLIIHSGGLQGNRSLTNEALMY